MEKKYCFFFLKKFKASCQTISCKTIIQSLLLEIVFKNQCVNIYFRKHVLSLNSFNVETKWVLSPVLHVPFICEKREVLLILFTGLVKAGLSQSKFSVATTWNLPILNYLIFAVMFVTEISYIWTASERYNIWKTMAVKYTT